MLRIEVGVRWSCSGSRSRTRRRGKVKRRRREESRRREVGWKEVCSVEGSEGGGRGDQYGYRKDGLVKLRKGGGEGELTVSDLGWKRSLESWCR